MSIELKGNGGYLNLRHSDWRDILDLAEMFGWNRKGTVAPRDLDRDESGEWPGCYNSNDFQVIHQDDAFEMSMALKRGMLALDDQSNLPPRKRFLRYEYELVKQVYRLTNAGNVMIF